MRTKNLIIAVSALCVAGLLIWVNRDQGDQGLADELVKQRQRVSTRPEKELARADAGYIPNSYPLSRRVMADRDESRSTWFVTSQESTSFVELPFAPPNDGEVVDDSSLASSDRSANPGFLGANACQECHDEKHSGFVHTAHFKTSGVVGEGPVHGNFTGPQSTMRTTDPNLSFTMTADGDRYRQKVSFIDWDLDFPLNVFTGSAKTGQTFLYWHEDELFQAFVSYLSQMDEWIPSPGYADTTVHYARRITTECLECHVTYIEQKRAPNVYKPETAIWGISCERCHGPGKEHAEYHRENPNEKLAKHIVQPADLPRDRQLDICAQCHSGSFNLLGGAFKYRPGDRLADFHLNQNPDAKGVGGIHTSNQLTRLSKSKCFTESQMTCTSCHNPHLNQRGDTKAFTASCLICHEPNHCGMSSELGDSVADNCVDCHMPVGDNEKMTLQVAGGSFTVQMIDHYIRVDEKATAEYLSE